MCRAVIESLHAAGHIPVACIEPDILLNGTGFRGTGFPARPQTLLTLDATRDVRTQWRETHSSCDATIVIAPESDGLLLELEAWCVAEGIRTCGSDPSFIEHAGDKWLTAQRLHQHQVPHPATHLLSHWNTEAMANTYVDTWVLKARDGVGCEGMQRVSAAELMAIQSASTNRERWIVQPWLEGQSYSRTAIVDAAGQCHWLPVVRQHLSIDRRVTYVGGRVLPDLSLTRDQSDDLQRAIDALVGRARGWVGVDFLLSEDGQLTVIEINPRLTTSFVGLSKACDRSLADLLVRAALGVESHFSAPHFLEQEFFVR